MLALYSEWVSGYFFALASLGIYNDLLCIIEHPDYKRLFPDLKTGRKATETEFETTLNGGRFATSVGATMVGMGANVLVVDDPITPEEVASETRRENVNEWFFSQRYQR